ncbi:MAG: type II toxin-antitoxin system VapC family toxin [Candidatus Rokubacteria bacterium]|nr:type II toxin-antitoxin system VapC family toxin [Candidatus Rokubacteria bacterium]
MAPLAYFDSSVLVKRYLHESGSPRAVRWLQRRRPAASAVASVEVTSALRRRRSAGEVSEAQFNSLLTLFRRDREHWELLEVSAEVLERAESIIRQVPLRTLDALHLASAVLLGEALQRRLAFVTADARQHEVAEALGLEVVWIG